MTIKYDNAQIIQLLVDESIKLQTKLQHFDIHSYWLRHEIQQQTIHLCWVLTKKMVAGGLTKLLITANFKVFIKMTRVENKKDLLALIEKGKKLKKTL